MGIRRFNGYVDRLNLNRLIFRSTYSLVMAATVMGAIVAALSYAVCRMAALNFVEQLSDALHAPFYFITTLNYLAFPIWLLIALLVFRFAPSVGTRRSFVLIIAVPVVLFAALAATMAFLYYERLFCI